MMRKLKQSNACKQLAKVTDEWRRRLLERDFAAWVAYMKQHQKDAGMYKAMVAWTGFAKKLQLNMFRVRMRARCGRGPRPPDIAAVAAAHRTCCSSGSGWRSSGSRSCNTRG